MYLNLPYPLCPTLTEEVRLEGRKERDLVALSTC